MAEYIKREMPDMNGNGERKAYYQVRSYSNQGRRIKYFIR